MKQGKACARCPVVSLKGFHHPLCPAVWVWLSSCVALNLVFTQHLLEPSFLNNMRVLSSLGSPAKPIKITSVSWLSPQTALPAFLPCNFSGRVLTAAVVPSRC